jgi:hypothetical protein
MIVDCAAGSSEFDNAFRKEIAKIYPDHPLKPLPPDHPMLHFVFDERHVTLAPLAKRLLPTVNTPDIEAIEVDGAYPVLYSPLSLSAGWEQLPRAYNKGYSDEDALKLGVNLFMYSISH